jgi:colicin import membrane protein
MNAVATQMENSLQILDEKEASLIELREKYAGLKISGLQDKEGYLKVREGRLALKNARVQVEKDGKALRENAVKFQKAVLKREKELVNIISTTEIGLQQEEDNFNTLREQMRLEEERKKREFIQGRIDALSKFGHAVDVHALEIMEEEDFQALLGEAEAAWQKEQARLAELKAEEDRKRKEEEERMAKERAELERMRAEHQKREAELHAQQQAAKEAFEKQQRELKAQQEAIESERRKIEEEKRIEAAKKEAAERDRIEEQERIEREAKEKEERERRAKEEVARQEALKPDKEKLLFFADLISGCCLGRPELKDDKANAIASHAIDHLGKVISYIRENVQGL